VGSGFLPEGMSDQARKVKLGNELKQLRDRRFGELRVERAGRAQRAVTWLLVEPGGPAPGAGAGESRESFSSPFSAKRKNGLSGGTFLAAGDGGGETHETHPGFFLQPEEMMTTR
jgi:hypothetical protein